MENTSFIYVIGEADSSRKSVKIGISQDPQDRLRQLQTGHPEKLSIHHLEPVEPARARIFERFIHDEIAYLRSHGEWFRLTPEEAIGEVRFAIIKWEGNPMLESIYQRKLAKRRR